MAWDFKKNPELPSSMVDFYYLQSPHKQIFEDFNAKVVKVHDGDTITLEWDQRDFPFKMRLLDIDAPELSEEKGEASKRWLEDLLLNEEVLIMINPKNRVGKFGRLLGWVLFKGLNINELAVNLGKAVPFNRRNEGKLKKLSELIAENAS